MKLTQYDNIDHIIFTATGNKIVPKRILINKICEKEHRRKFKFKNYRTIVKGYTFETKIDMWLL